MTNNLEIMQLKNQIKDLEKKLDNMTSQRCVAFKCQKAPYTAIRYSEKHDEFYFSYMRTEEWNKFRELSKYLFLRKNELTKGEYPVLSGRVRKIIDLTPEQQALAAEFLDEVVEVFNKYFMEINREIIVDGKPVIVRAAE